jgi:hypothetical protein
MAHFFFPPKQEAIPKKLLIMQNIFSDCDFDNDGEYQEIANYLLRNKANINSRDFANYTSLYYARQMKNSRRYIASLIQWILVNGAIE